MYTSRPVNQGGLDSWTEWLYEQVLALPKEQRTFVRNEERGVFGFTDARHTRHVNQDRLTVATRSGATPRDSWGLAVVCDGLGGSGQGERAASLAVASLVAEVASASPVAPAEVTLVSAFHNTHSKVFHAFGGRSATTVVAIYVRHDRVVVGWVGDSRIYSLGPKGLEQVSRDDTLRAALNRVPGRVADLVNDEFADRLSQAIGGEVPVKPSVVRWTHDLGGCLLCTDGVWKPLDGVIDKLVSHCRDDGGELARRLLLNSEWLGGEDNSTALWIPFVQGLLVPPVGTTRVASAHGAVQILLPGHHLVCWPLHIEQRRPVTVPQADVQQNQHPVNRSDSSEEEKPSSSADIESVRNENVQSEKPRSLRGGKGKRSSREDGAAKKVDEPPPIVRIIEEANDEAETKPPGSIHSDK